MLLPLTLLEFAAVEVDVGVTVAATGFCFLHLLFPAPLKVIFACPSDTALAILGEEASIEERDALGRFKFSDNTIYVHR